MDIFYFGPQVGPEISSSYDLVLVGLSYFIACFASYVALDVTERVRTEEASESQNWWLLFGAFAMGSGIWTMHFIGMLAFIMPMPMSYDPIITLWSFIVAVIASGLAFYLIKNRQINAVQLMVGGIFMGLGIVCMHYTGMAAMQGVHIRYHPGLFFLSIIIAILASEAALALMIKSSKKDTRFPQRLKAGSALIMGLAICGMHYTGMYAAVFTHAAHGENLFHIGSELSPDRVSFYVAASTVLILAIALTASKSWTYALQIKNQKLIETEAILAQTVDNAVAKEERIRMILAAAADGIMVIDEKGIIEICNQAGENITGFSSSKLINQNISSLIFLPENFPNQKFRSISFSKLLEKQHGIQQLYFINSQMNYIPIELTISKSTSNNYIIVFRDITERKLAEEKLELLNKELISTARRAGMADVATAVLHNIGNVLNSVNTSVQILLERDKEFKLDGINELSLLFNKNKDNLEGFLKNDRIGQHVPQYLEQFAKYIVSERSFYREELASLNNKVSHIKKIVSMQQALSGGTSMAEPTDVIRLIEEALMINAENIEKFGIVIEKEYSFCPTINIDRVRIIQILVNLIKNATEVLIETKRSDKKITIRTLKDGLNQIQIDVIDNGKGIAEENLTKIFAYGFTTKKTGHGIGLHSSSLSAQEIGGSLKAYSEGLDRGTTFTLRLPLEGVSKKV